MRTRLQRLCASHISTARSSDITCGQIAAEVSRYLSTSTRHFDTAAIFLLPHRTLL